MLSWRPVDSNYSEGENWHLQLDFHDLIFNSEGTGICEVDWTNMQCNNVILHMDTVVSGNCILRA